MDWLTYTNQGATRSQPLSNELLTALAFLDEMGVRANVYSGGQPAIGTSDARVGSTRHDLGHAGDFHLVHPELGMLSHENPDHIPVLQEIVRRGRAAGLTGIGMGPGYMGPNGIHMGFGNDAVWGAGGSSANAPDWLREAYYGAEAGATPEGLYDPSRPPSVFNPPPNALASGRSGSQTDPMLNALRMMEALRPPQMQQNALNAADFMTPSAMPQLIPITGV